MPGHKVGMITYVQTLGARPPEICEGQKVENSARFRTSFNFDREYLRNQSKYQKLETNLIDVNSCWVQQKIGRLWSTNKKVAGTDVDLP